MADKKGDIWAFPIYGGKIDYKDMVPSFLPPPVDSLHRSDILLVPCQPQIEGSKYAIPYGYILTHIKVLVQ